MDKFPNVLRWCPAPGFHILFLAARKDRDPLMERDRSSHGANQIDGIEWLGEPTI